jgi:DNA polymerase bacteriophage-type
VAKSVSNMLWVDFETRSHCDLKRHGVYNYAQDLTTDVLCMSYAFDDEDVVTWLPTQPFPERVRNHKGLIYAHNAAFERLIFWYVLQINFELEQFYCTATQARANCAPGSLEDVGRFAGASMKKDYRGAQLIRALCVPPFKEDAALMTEMVQYCEQDVRAMRAVSQSLRPLSDEELLDYHVNEKINDRGVLVDVRLADAAISYAANELEDIQSIVRAVTNGAITSVRSPKMREWVKERLSPEQLKLMEVEDGKYSIDKRVRANLLAVEDLPPDVAEVIQCADDLWASSVAKFSRLKDLADVEDNRVRGAFVFAGGSATGRASSYGAQVHNFTRKCAKEPELVRGAMVSGDPIVPAYGKRVTDVLKGMLRPAIIPAKGKSLVVADWAQIEARMTPWLSGRGDDVLDVFRSGRDIYVREAAAMYKIPEDQVTPDQRQIGKVAILACGFGGGLGAFSAMGRAYGLTMTESDAQRTVDAWRRANQWAVRYWQELETGYMIAMRNKGREIVAGRVTYLYDGAHLWYALPSGRILCYPFAKIEEDGISYAKAAWKPAADASAWPRARLWRGLACENITQAAANDVLRYALRALDDVVLHVHDEIVIETDQPKQVTERLRKVMCTPPPWAVGLPLDAEISTMTRYGKG